MSDVPNGVLGLDIDAILDKEMERNPESGILPREAVQASERGPFKLERPEGAPAPFFESITQATAANGARLRVWRREDILPEYNDVELQNVIGDLEANSTMRHIVKTIAALPRITAIEIVDPMGNGAVIYLEW